MVSFDKVQRGVAKYLDEELTAKLSGWQKWVFGAGAAMFISNSAEMVDRYKDNEIVKALGLIGPDRSIDVEKAYMALKAQAAKGPITIDAPMLGGVTLDASDVEKLYRCIMQ